MPWPSGGSHDGPGRGGFDSMEPQQVLPKVAKALAAAGAVRGTIVMRSSSEPGWILVLQVGMSDQVLRMRDVATPRIFRSVDAAASFAASIKIPRVTVELAGWQPVTRPKTMPAAPRRRRR